MTIILKLRKIQMIIIVSLMILVQVGCSTTTTAYKAPIGQFKDASQVVIESTKVYLGEFNKVERDKYIDAQVAAARPIRLIDIDKVKNLTPEEAAIRAQALDQLARYGELLVKIANSDAPEAIAANAVSLGQALSNLNQTIQESLKRPVNEEFKSAVGPVSIILGEVARLAIERQIQKALDKAIKEGDQPIQNLLAVLREEANTAYRNKLNYFSKGRKDIIDLYNIEQRKPKPDPKALKAYAEQVKTQLDKWDTLVESNPREGLQAMAQAHTALVTYANSPKTPKDLSDFIAAMEDFLARAKKVGKAVKDLSEL
jgi:hypothetical protein